MTVRKVIFLLTLLVGYGLSQVTRTVTVSAPQSTSPSYEDSKLFEQDTLAVHNLFRSQHNASALAWNQSLAQTADSWASHCVWAHSHGPTGENLAAGFANASAAIEAWGNERDQFDFRDPTFTEQTGHFSQLVWKATTTVGCGRKLCATSTVPGWFVVCEYWPAGNVIGSFKENVAPQTSASTLNNGTIGSSTPDGRFGPMKGDARTLRAIRAWMSAVFVVGIWLQTC